MRIIDFAKNNHLHQPTDSNIGSKCGAGATLVAYI